MTCKSCNRRDRKKNSTTDSESEYLKQMLEAHKLAGNKLSQSGGVRRILIKNHLSPGDITMLTAAVRDLHRAHPGKFETAVDTSCSELWENNPYITERSGVYEEIQADYPLVNSSNTNAYHFIHGFAQDLEDKLGVRIPVTDMKGDIYLSDEERGWISTLEEIGIKDDFWIIVAGGKFDFTAKWWNPDFYQDVVDHFKGKITFVQTGDAGHFHPQLRGVVNLIGKTDLRQFIRLVYHSVGVLCPVTFAMHAAAAVPTREGRPKNRACVVVAGGREPQQWEAYPHHRFLSLNGALPCCDNGGCWKSRCTKVGDNDDKDNDLCFYPVTINTKTPLPPAIKELNIAKCMNMITPADVIKSIENYYDGGSLKYGSCIPKWIPTPAKNYVTL